MSEVEGAAPATASATPATPSVTPASTGPATTAQAASAPATGDTSSAKGPIPFDVHHTALENARMKARGDVEREFRERYGWADQFQQDPYPFVEAWVDQLAQHRELGPKMLAKAARLLQSRRGTQAPAAAERPKADVPVVDAQGNLTGYVYSDKQQDALDEWRWAQREASIFERLAPLEQRNAKETKREEIAEAEKKSVSNAVTTLTRMRQSVRFKENEHAFKAFFHEHEEYVDDVQQAWADYLDTVVLPREQTKVLDHLKTQAAGASVHPGPASASGPPKFKSFGEAARYYAEHAEEAEAMAER